MIHTALLGLLLLCLLFHDRRQYCWTKTYLLHYWQHSTIHELYSSCTPLINSCQKTSSTTIQYRQSSRLELHRTASLISGLLSTQLVARTLPDTILSSRSQPASKYCVKSITLGPDAETSSITGFSPAFNILILSTPSKKHGLKNMTMIGLQTRP